MNIKDLKEKISDLPDDMPVCVWDEELSSLNDEPIYSESEIMAVVNGKYTPDEPPYEAIECRIFVILE